MTSSLGLSDRLLEGLFLGFESLLGTLEVRLALLQLVLGGLETLASLLREVTDLSLQALRQRFKIR